MRATGNSPEINRTLSIRVSADGFSFCTLRGWKHFRHLPPDTLADSLDRELRRLRRLRGEYNEVRLLADYPSTRVPLDEFRSEQEQTLYRLTFGDRSLQGLAICHEVLPRLDIVELFPISPALRDIVLRHYPEATLHGFYAIALQDAFALHKDTASQQQRTLYAVTHGDSLLLCSFAGDTLAFANTFTEADTNNRLYFTLYAWKLLRLSQEDDRLALLALDAGDPFEPLLRRYLRNVSCVS